MKKLTIFTLTFVLISSFCCAQDRPKVLINALQVGRYHNLSQEDIDLIFAMAKNFPNGTELSFAFVAGDSTEAAGIKRQNDSLVYVENGDRIFEIGMLSSTFTATILAKLVTDGVVKPDAPIKDLLPIKLQQSSMEGSEITLKTLANHTAGLPFVPTNLRADWNSGGGPFRDYDKGKLYDYLSHQLTIQSTPGGSKEYSALGAGLLSHILTLVAQKPFARLLSEAICTPLRMENTKVELTASQKKKLVYGRTATGKIIASWEWNILTGAGGIKSTANDLAKYIKANLADTSFFGLTHKPTLDIDENFAVGLGWTIYKREGIPTFLLYGGMGGYSSGIVFEISTQTGIVILSNVAAAISEDGDYVPMLCRHLHNALRLRPII